MPLPANRFEYDDRIIVIDNWNGFALYKNKDDLGFNGILMPCDDISEDDVKRLLGYGDRLVKKNPVFRTKNAAMQIDLGRNLLGEPPDGVSKNFIILGEKMMRAFKEAALDPLRDIPLLQYNAQAHTEFLTHSPTININFLKKGTLVQKPDGSIYEIPCNHVFLFDETIVHASDPDSSFSDPRIMAVVF